MDRVYAYLLQLLSQFTNFNFSQLPWAPKHLNYSWNLLERIKVKQLIMFESVCFLQIIAWTI